MRVLKKKSGTKVSVNVTSGNEDTYVYWDPADCISTSRAGSEDLHKDEQYIRKWLYSPAKVVRILDNNEIIAQTADGENHRLQSGAMLKKVSPQDQEGVPNILILSNFSDRSLLHSLRTRYERNDVYSFVGPILISINPYKWITGLYDESAMVKYQSSLSTLSVDKQAVPPHLFCVADAAYVALVGAQNKAVNQSIIISGESGAGKTEATKKVMQYLARIQANSKSKGEINKNTNGLNGQTSQVGELENRVLSCNPLLEAFGNACTLRNDNSSRFGKFIQIQFSKQGHITGANIQNYLLERTRIVRQVDGERNYHIFYQLLNCENQALISDLNLRGGARSFNYLGGNHAQYTIDEHSDSKSLATTMSCLNSIGVKEETQNDIFKLLAIVLHLGNITFKEVGREGEETCHVEETEIKDGIKRLTFVSTLMGVAAHALEQALCTKQLYVGGNIVVKQQTIDQASDKRDALAKAIYSQLFVWLVSVLNRTICSPPDSLWRFIGVLDIYGFEKFDMNGLEQLLINFANEKLQRHFNKHIFEVEQDEYASEGIDWSYIDFNDNQPCLDLIEGKPEGKPGVLTSLDDVQRFKGAEADAKFLAQLAANHGPGSAGSTNHPNYIVPRFNTNEFFGLRHYAGDVFYSCIGFTDRNSDALSQDLKDLLGETTNSLIQETFSIGDALERHEKVTLSRIVSTPSRQMGRIREVSVGAQFKLSLGGLMTTIASTNPRYIRCMKPNHHKLPNALDALEVLRQLRYAGMMETVRIRQQGYALREDHKEFYRKYSVLFPNVKDLNNLVEQLGKFLKIDIKDWQIGYTKVFLRASLAERLEILLGLRVRSSTRKIQKARRECLRRRAAIKIQSVVRFYPLYKLYKKKKASATKIQACWKGHIKYTAFKRARYLIIHTQAHARGMIGRRLAKDLKFPYQVMPPSELLTAEEEAEKELGAALEAREFSKCTELQDRLSAIQRAIEQRGITRNPEPAPSKPTDTSLSPGRESRSESQSHMSREEIDLRLLETQLRLADAEEHKNYVLCGQLQEALDALLSMKKQHPTSAEAEKRLSSMKEDLASAMSRKDFSTCARLQANVDALEMEVVKLKEQEKTEQHVDDDDPMLKDRLENEMKTASADLERAKSARNFARCAELQEKIESIIAQIDAIPTVDSVRNLIRETRVHLETSKTEKNFAEVAKSTILLQKLERKLKCVVKSSLLGLTRNDLKLRLSQLEEEFSNAMEKRQYESCERIQTEIDMIELEIANLPSLEQIEAALYEKEEELAKALASKQFEQCARLEADLTKLREQRAEFPQPDSSPSESPAQLSPLGSPRTEDRSMRSFTQSPQASTAPISTNVEARTLNISTNVTARRCSNADDHRTVAKLRPKKPTIQSVDASIFTVAQAMSAAKSDACLLIGHNGILQGILTDNDLVRRVVSKKVSIHSKVSQVMTRSPHCVTTDDSAMESLGIMLERKFRHLPVTDNEGRVTGLLDIAKCLNDAITRLERVSSKNSSSASDKAAAVKNMSKAFAAGGKKNAQVSQSRAMQQLMNRLLGEQGQTTVNDVILQAELPLTYVSPRDTVLEASEVIAETKNAVLVVEKGKLKGIFTPKDVLDRIVARGIEPSDVNVGDVLTPNPDIVTPDTAALDALQQMYDCHYLHLPVVAASGKIVGVVNAVELIHATIGQEGSPAWQALFGASYDEDDDISETASIHSTISPVSIRMPSSVKSVSAPQPLPSNKVVDHRPVSKLRPKMPVILPLNTSIAEVAAKMTSAKSDACLLVNSNGSLAGIVTDNDMTRRVVASGVDVSCPVSQIMTHRPRCVNKEDSAMEALGIMIERKFRHLPVTDNNGSITGLLDIARCLYDAITRLERVVAKRSSGINDLKSRDGVDTLLKMTQAIAKNRSKMTPNQAAVMQSLMADMFGEAGEPVLSDVLASATKVFFVSPKDTVHSAAVAMKDGRKAVLVLDKGKLVGIFTPKDVLTRVLARNLSPQYTSVKEVMTPNPDFVSPDTPVLEALHQMRENHYLHLPVVNEKGKVFGLVDVMEIINATIGAEGSTAWEALFGSVIDEDDFSETGSIRSLNSHRSKMTNSTRSKGNPDFSKSDDRPVSKLRPKAPITMLSSASISEVAAKMGSTKNDACLILNRDGSIAGIVTDNDMARRVVAKDVDVYSPISSVMTPRPRCVSKDDSAMEALSIMLERKFRHLPVTQKSGDIVGILDIAKCLYDAISRLDKVIAKKSSKSHDLRTKEGAEALKQISRAMACNRRGVSATQAAVMQQLIEQMFGDEGEPTLETVLASSGPAHFVSPRDTVRQAAILMLKSRKAVVVVDRSRLVGIFTPKDIVCRVLANDLSPDEVLVGEVMTPSPDTVEPRTPVLDALHQMHEQHYLHLPIVDTDDRVIGVVDVMEIINATVGKEGSTAWKALFGSIIDDDDFSDVASLRSARSFRSRGPSSAHEIIQEERRAFDVDAKDVKTVTSLRPKRALLIPSNELVINVVEAMAMKRTDACLLTAPDGSLNGIITDNDITRRVIADDADPNTTCVADVMTRNPVVIDGDMPAIQALGIMAEKKFRHLPVRSASGTVTGILDIAACLYEAIAKLEKAASKSNDEGAAMMEMLERKGALNSARMINFSSVMSQVFSTTTIEHIVGDSLSPIFITPRDTVRVAARVMSKCRKGVMVLEQKRLVGILTPRDLLNRVLAQHHNPDEVRVINVMTKNPDTVVPSTQVVEALHHMHSYRFLHLPVVEENGRVLGLVDVLDIIRSTIGKDGSSTWNTLFNHADDISDIISERSGVSHLSNTYSLSREPRILPAANSYRESTSTITRVQQAYDVPQADVSDTLSFPDNLENLDYDYVFKVSDPDSNTYRIRISSGHLNHLKDAVAEKMGLENSSSLILRYIDNENDSIVISGDDTLRDAIEFSRGAGENNLRIQASIDSGKLNSSLRHRRSQLTTVNEAVRCEDEVASRGWASENATLLCISLGVVAISIGVSLMIIRKNN